MLVTSLSDTDFGKMHTVHMGNWEAYDKKMLFILFIQY